MAKTIKTNRTQSGQTENPSRLPTTTAAGYEPNIKLAIICALAGFLLYANTIKNNYALDDYAVITENQYVQQGIKGIPAILGSDVWHFENVSLGYYRPLSLITFAIENQFFPNNPHIAHFDNAIIYAVSGFALCLLLMLTFRQQPPLFSLLVSLLFITHPLHTEVVANIKSRDELLSFLNLLIAGWLLLRAVSAAQTRPSHLDYFKLAISCIFFYLALLSKESAMAGVLLLPLLLYFSGRLPVKRILACTVPFIVLVLAFQLQKFVALGTLTGNAGHDILNYPYLESGQQLPATFAIFAWSIKMLLLPFPLAYSYAYNQIPVSGWGTACVLAGILLAAVFVFALSSTVKFKKPPLAGLLIVGITLLPGLAFALLKGGIFAERFLYAPVLGFSIITVAIMFRFNNLTTEIKLSDFAKTYRISIPILAILLLYSVETIARNNDWKDDITLYANDVNTAPNSAQTHLHYGVKLIETALATQAASVKASNLNTGMAQLNTALSIAPQIPEAWYEKGRAYHFLAGNNDSAILCYNQAILQSPAYALSYFGLAGVYENTNQLQLASYYYNKGVETDPANIEGKQALNNFKKRTGLDVKTFPGFGNTAKTEITDSTHDFTYYNKMGELSGKKGDFENAIIYLQKSAALNPDYVSTYINLSVCYGMTKNYSKCIEVLNKVLQLDPANVTGLNNLAIIYDHVGEKEKAVACRNKLNALKGK